MNLNKGLNTYEKDMILEQDQKKIYFASIFVCAFFLLVSVILTIIFNQCYTLIVGYAIGALTSILLFKRLTNVIVTTYYKDYPKAVKKLHLMFQIVYLLVYLGTFIIFRDYFIVIGTTFGFLTIKISIILSPLIAKNNK